MQSKIEVQELMNALLPLVRKSLQAGGSTAPIAGAVDQNGQLQRVLPEVTPDQPLATVKGLVEQLRGGVAEGSLRAIAVMSVVNVHSPRGGDPIAAVQAALEHEDGYAVNIYFPIERVEGQVRLCEPFAGKRERAVFVQV